MIKKSTTVAMISLLIVALASCSQEQGSGQKQATSAEPLAESSQNIKPATLDGLDIELGDASDLVSRGETILYFNCYEINGFSPIKPPIYSLFYLFDRENLTLESTKLKFADDMSYSLESDGTFQLNELDLYYSFFHNGQLKKFSRETFEVSYQTKATEFLGKVFPAMDVRQPCRVLDGKTAYEKAIPVIGDFLTALFRERRREREAELARKQKI
jgi:hypothetical protein